MDLAVNQIRQTTAMFWPGVFSSSGGGHNGVQEFPYQVKYLSIEAIAGALLPKDLKSEYDRLQLSVRDGLVSGGPSNAVEGYISVRIPGPLGKFCFQTANAKMRQSTQTQEVQESEKDDGVGDNSGETNAVFASPSIVSHCVMNRNHLRQSERCLHHSFRVWIIDSVMALYRCRRQLRHLLHPETTLRQC